MLQTIELHAATRTTVGDDSWAWLRPPEPCAEGAYPSAGMRLGSRTISAEVRFPGPPALTVEYVAVYLPNGARRYVRDLHRAMDRCRGIDAQGSWDILDAGVAGRDSLLLRLRHDVTHADRTAARNTYLAVARVGRVLVVVADVGGAAGDGRRELVEQLINPALRRTYFLL